MYLKYLKFKVNKVKEFNNPEDNVYNITPGLVTPKARH
jgi:hypothetical protein